jgi:hypothetical protein
MASSRFAKSQVLADVVQCLQMAQLLQTASSTWPDDDASAGSPDFANLAIIVTESVKTFKALGSSACSVWECAGAHLWRNHVPVRVHNCGMSYRPEGG